MNVSRLPALPNGEVELGVVHASAAQRIIALHSQEQPCHRPCLARALDRGYSDIHADVKALAGAGLLETAPRYMRADYDPVETRIAF